MFGRQLLWSVFLLAERLARFTCLREGMDKMWGVKLAKGQPFWKRVRQKLVPFLVVTALGLVVVVWTAFASSLYGAIEAFSVNQVLTFVVLGLAQLLVSFLLALCVVGGDLQVAS